MRKLIVCVGILVGLLFGKELIKQDVVGDSQILPEEQENCEEVYGNIKVKKGCSVQRGLASWYSPRFHGRKTASGERHDTSIYTAASLKLPIGSYALVVSPETGKKVVVRINDRGPHVKGRIIDLSYAAARKLGLVRKGVGEVVVIPLYCLSSETQAMLYDQLIADVIRTF